MEFNLERFLEAQDSGSFGITFEKAMQLLKDGKELKEGLWYIFPTLKEFGSSENDKFFGLPSLYAAYEYWAVPKLRDRLKEAVATLIRNRNGRSAEQILGDEGARRLHSCIMLFEPVYPEVMFYDANEKFFDGKWDKDTAKAIRPDWENIHENVWKKYKSKYPQRAFFDLSCQETRNLDGKEITDEERYASFMDLVKRGYNVYRLAWNYLVLRDWLGNKERERYTSEALLQTYEYLREDLREWLEENHYDTRLLDALFPDMELKIFSQEVSWGQAAYLLDALARFAISYPQLNPFVEETIKTHSLLSNVECPDKLLGTDFTTDSILSKSK